MNARKLNLTLAWMIFATLVMFIAIWQVKRVLDQEHLAKQASLAPPAKTKSGRVILPVSLRDPEADYLAACKKGLSDPQIRWILDDFRNAGLEKRISPASLPGEITAVRKAGSIWYHGILVETLHLSREQSDQASRVLKALFEAEPPESSSGASSWFHDASNQFSDPIDSRYQPWRLCGLTPQQSAITWQDGYRPPVTDTDVDTAWILKNADPAGASGKTLLRGPEDMSGIPNGFPTWALSANTVFPLMDSQVFETESLGLFEPEPPETGEELLPESNTSPLLIGNIRKLHPSQLKILLLLHPEYSADIRSMLEE